MISSRAEGAGILIGVHLRLNFFFVPFAALR
jgi:hypothetical protein